MEQLKAKSNDDNVKKKKLENVFYFFMVTIVLEIGECLKGRKFDNLMTGEANALKFPDNFLNLQYIEENLTPKEFTIPHLFDNILPVYNAYCEVAAVAVIEAYPKNQADFVNYLNKFLDYAAQEFFRIHFKNQQKLTPEQKVLKDVAARTANLFGLGSEDDCKKNTGFKKKILAFFYKLMKIKDIKEPVERNTEKFNQPKIKEFTNGQGIENYYILHRNSNEHATWVSIRNVK